MVIHYTLAHTLHFAHTHTVLYDSVVPKLPTLVGNASGIVKLRTIIQAWATSQVILCKRQLHTNSKLIVISRSSIQKQVLSFMHLHQTRTNRSRNYGRFNSGSIADTPYLVITSHSIPSMHLLQDLVKYNCTTVSNRSQQILSNMQE